MNAAITGNRRIFPSTLAAVVMGAAMMPLFMLGWRFIEAVSTSQALVLVWFVVAFFIPVLFATADLGYAARRRRELGGLFRPLTSAEDFRLFYIPTLRRMLLLFISAVVSVFGLKALGVHL